MGCRHCGSDLDRPGDYCLVCRTANADVAVLELGRERATVTVLADDEVVSARTVTTTPEDGGETGVVELRNFAGLIADEVRRKRPEEVYVTGDRAVVDAVRGQLHYPFYRVEDDDPVDHVRERRSEPSLEVVETAPDEKLGGSHSTLVGGRAGQRAIRTVAGHPHVKKVIPGPIDAGGSGSRTGVRAKATRADEHGNVRLLIRDGSSVQENRIVTTAGDRDLGERVREDLNEALVEAALQESA
ncbi:metal-binding protein [Halobacteriales archaeon QS_4_62_28]|nr:MAG: metal-binding protein [Halobacteriales archaeon QS_4_62_28]